MTEVVVAAMIGFSALTFLTAWFAWQLKDGLHEAYAMFCMLMSSALSVGMASFMRGMFEEVPSSYSAILSTLDAVYYAVIVWFFVSLVYFTLRVMISPMIAASKKKRFKTE